MTQYVFNGNTPQIKFYQDKFKVLPIEGPILYFFLLILGISLDLGRDASHKQDKFSKILLKKGFEFIISRKYGIVASKLSFMLLPAEVNPVSEKWNCKEDVFVTCGFSCVKMILTLSTKVVVLYVQAAIV